MGWFKGEIWKWTLVWERQLLYDELQQVEDLCTMLQQQLPIRDKSDHVLWCKKKEFSAKKLLQKVDKVTSHTAKVDWLVSSVWVNLAPPKIEFFLWIALLGKLNTKHMLHRKGILPAQALNCNFCGLHIEDVDHLLLSCSFSWSIWSSFTQAFTQ